jgi:hypothetical protein
MFTAQFFAAYLVAAGRRRDQPGDRIGLITC